MNLAAFISAMWLIPCPHDGNLFQDLATLLYLQDETEIADDYKAELQAVLNSSTADMPHIDEVD